MLGIGDEGDEELLGEDESLVDVLSFNTRVNQCKSGDVIDINWDTYIEEFDASYNLERDVFSKRKHRPGVEYVRDLVRQSKIAIDKTPKPHARVLVPSKNLSHEQLRYYASLTPLSRMARDWRKLITSQIPRSVLTRFPQVAVNLFNDIDKHYAETNLEISINDKVMAVEESERYVKIVLSYKFLGRTENYDEFLKTVKHLNKRLFVTKPMLRRLLQNSMKIMPSTLVDFTKFRGPLTVGLNILLVRISEELANMKERTIKPLYDDVMREISLVLCADPPKKPKPLWYQYINTARFFLKIRVMQLLCGTMENLLYSLSSSKLMPIFSFRLTYERVLVLTPSLSSITSFYHSIIDEIKEYTVKLADSTTFTTKGYDCTRVHVEVPTFLVEKAHIMVDESFSQLFEPVIDHLICIEDEYKFLFQEELAAETFEFINANHSFDECCNKVDFFRTFLDNVSRMDQTVYFEIGTVNQVETISTLQTNIESFMQSLWAHLIEKTAVLNHSICREYEKLADRAKLVPKTTLDLVQTGEYMLWAKTVLLVDLHEQMAITLDHIMRLIEMTTLSQKDIDLNSQTLTWLERIKPILENHNVMFEQRKGELEEELKQQVIKLEKGLQAFLPLLELLDDMSDADRADEYCEMLRNMTCQLQDFERILIWANNEETLFKIALSSFPELDECKNIIYPFYDLVFLCAKWKRHYSVWADGPWDNLVIEDVEFLVEDYFKEFQKHQKNFRTKIRIQTAEKYPRRFKGSVEDKDIYKQPAPLKLCFKMLNYIKEFRPMMQIITVMRNTALLQRHWDDMGNLTGFDITPDAGTTLRKIHKQDFSEFMEMFEIISVGATKELQLKIGLAKMKDEWVDITFKTNLYKDTGLSVLTALDDIQVVLDDHILKTLSMRGSAFVKPIEAEVVEWYHRITRVNRAIEEWGKVQCSWAYLLPIFSSKDIVGQMPEEGALFKEVDGTFKRYMQMVDRDPRVMEIAPAVGLLETLIECNKMLDKINEGVTNYLEKKRIYFPRFFFLSNDEMLEILSETKDPLRVQPHLRKCFEGICKLHFDKKLVIHAMYSQEGERVDFLIKISTEDARGSVEKWLVQVEEQMVLSVREEIYHSKKNYEEIPRTIWVTKWEGQVVLCVSQIYWTREAEYCLIARSVKELNTYYANLVVQLNAIVAQVRSPDISNLARITIKALIVIDVHAKDVIQELVDKKVDSINDFQWLAQLRYYWQDEALVRIINATVRYAYEYLGNSDRLVITPLTDRCYRTLIGAYQLHLNGAPEGPAGTGKTETTKDLAKAIAVQCVVFNCSDGLDYKAMGKFFKGLAASGAWVCFDEFNRIELEVLSVVAQQILCIVLAVRAGAEKFLFEGTELRLIPTCYVCITMNPGYAGRSELPDNLKVLFRTVAMMVPDYAMIGEISLYSYGFVNARILSVKIVQTYRLCSEQLSSQNHYDYGMRAVKTVLSACGNNKRAFPDENEDIILLRSITDVNLPKFLSFDVPLFEGIISDLFPGVVLPKPDYSVLLPAIIKTTHEYFLQPEDAFLLKVIQTYEMMIVRHGFMLVGEPFGGKTMCLRVLAGALTYLNHTGQDQLEVRYQTINPKSITMGQLYGQFDPVSYEWTDGVVATCFRSFAMDPSPDRKWVIFDGPVDAVWIENMNTVLDDNKKLCLMSGEVIAMTNVMSMIFEVMDLSQASPATVSRCGMIYTEPITLGWRAMAKSWAETANPHWAAENIEYIMETLEWLVPPTLYFVRKQCHVLCTGGEINSVKSSLVIVEMLMNGATQDNLEEQKHHHAWIQASMLTGIVWGIGGTLNAESRALFDEFYRAIWKNENETVPLPSYIDITIPLPGDGMFMDYYYVYRMKGSWKYWPDDVKLMPVQESKSLAQTLVPTLDVVRYMFFLKLHIKWKFPMLMIGPTGTGKTFYIQNLMMKSLSMNKYEPSFITFTVQISANQTQELIISKLHKHKRGNYGAPKGKESIIFIDDMNLPVKEIYGAQPPIELIRQFFDHGHWYDLKDTSKIFLYNILFLGAMGPVGGSRQEIYQRFLRHFNIYSINDFSDESMFKIFSTTLLQGLKRNGFAQDVMMHVIYIINATIDIYKAASANLRPTPAKSHYIFNLRDFARVIQGCAMLKKESAGDSKSIFVRLWVHEVLRVFYDRLIDDEGRIWLYEKLKKSCKDFFKQGFEQVMEDLPRDAQGKLTRESLNDLLFGTYLDLDSTPDERKYEEISGMEVFENIALTCLDDYNSSHKTKMNIVLFRYALEHLSKVCRILSMPCGSGLLVGVGGSGRQSITRLAATICGFGTFQPEITKSYGVSEWRDDIKRVLKESGGLGKDTVFLFNEGQIKEEIFLQDIDGLLNSGEVPNIYAIDEKQEILELTRLAAQGGNRALDVSILEIFSFFTNRCKEKLHIILCFSPVGSALRTRLRLYPALVNCCTIDWFEGWPENALEMVADRYMLDINLPDHDKQAAAVACKHFHVCARDLSDEFYAKFGRKTYITSASYLDLIRCFAELTNQKQEELTTARNRYIIGLEQLAFAAEQVAIMQIELNALKPKLVEMAQKCTEMMRVIEYETKEVEKTSVLVRADEEAANIQASAAQALKSECEADLALALPILEEAVGALNTLKPADITLVKSMKNPPDTVKLVMAAVCVMKNIQPDKVPDPASGKKVLDYWGPSKRLLGDMNFLQLLKDYDKDNIPVATMTKIRKEFLTNANFNPAIVAKASTAAQGLCKWIIALDLYDKVAKVVGPKKEKLAIAESEFNATMAILTEKRNMLRTLEERLADLNQQLADANAEMKRLHDDVKLCTEKLIRAEKLIGGLGGEKTRWTAAAAQLLASFESLAGDVLISCAIIAYLSPFTLQVRQDTIDDWHQFVLDLNLPASPTYNLRTILGSDIKIQDWYINGLPNDSFSTDNAIIMDTSKRCSLLVDPQGQANAWIKTMEKKNKLHVVKFTDGNYMKIMEHCLEYGQPVLIESVLETLDAPIDPILERKTYIQGGTEYLSLGDTTVEWGPTFRLYLTTTLRNPHYLPEVFNKITLINFSLTVEGLEDQLLGIVVAKERPDLQEKRQQLIIESAENKVKLKDTEAMILRTLSETEGNILEDQTAIDILDSSKILSEDIMKKQVIAKETEIKIDASRESYKPMAKHSAVLYYCISELPSVDPMYQYSLGWFINLYISSIGNASKSNDLEKRLKFLIATFDYDLYNNVCRSLFERDKLLFSFILYTKIMLFKKKIDLQLFVFFLTAVTPPENPYPNPAKDWLSNKSWDEICHLDSFELFGGFRQSFVQNIRTWNDIYDSSNPQDIEFPQPWDKMLGRFEKLVVIRFLRPDKTVVTITKTVAAEMGEKFTSPPPFNIARSYADSTYQFPLIFILSPGVDPMAALCSFAEKMGFDDKFKYISLGQGQGPIAQAMIAQAQVEEQWVCLQNCHLAVSWMSKLEKICESFDSTNTRSGFRLWLTSYPSDRFPISVLQNGVKMTNEPPTGLTQNLLRSYQSEPLKEDDFYSGCPGKDVTFHRLLYGMCFFHAVIQERRTFGPIGWNIPYGFNESDFHISVMQLQIFINESADIPYVAVSYLAGECNYGGRVTDDWDRRCITTILADFINEKVVFDSKYTFTDAGPMYCPPKKTNYDDVIQFIKDLPSIHPPGVFGLHMNAGIRRDLRDSMQLIDSALIVQGKGGSSGTGADAALALIVNDILLKLPPAFDIEEANAKFPVVYTESMNTVLVQEMQRFNKLHNEIKSSLINIQKAVKGLVVMSPQLEVLSNTLLLGKLPASWAKVSYPSLKSLSSYIIDFVQRMDFLYDWFLHGKPKSFWLSGFFFTQAFLSGAKQNFARKYTIPIDQLTFDFFVLKTDKGGDPAPADGIHIYGLFIEGAIWDRKKLCLDEQKPKILYEMLPAIWMLPLTFAKFQVRGRYLSPLYKTSERRGILSTTGHSTNYVLPFLLETKQPVQHWIKRSVALLCQLD